MIKHDARIGMGYDFKAGGMFEDMSFEKDRTLLQVSTFVLRYQTQKEKRQFLLECILHDKIIDVICIYSFGNISTYI